MKYGGRYTPKWWTALSHTSDILQYITWQKLYLKNKLMCCSSAVFQWHVLEGITTISYCAGTSWWSGMPQNQPTNQRTEGRDLRENARQCPPICLAVPALTASLGAITDTLTFKRLLVTWCTISLIFNNCTLCPHFIYVFCIYLRTNSDLCHLQHKLIGFYNRDEKCLQRGTDWVFKYSGLRLVFKGSNVFANRLLV